MHSTFRELPTRCSVGRLVSRHQSVRNKTATTYNDHSIKQSNHFSVEERTGVARFDSSKYVSPLRFPKREPNEGLRFEGSCRNWFKNWPDKRLHKLTASTFGGAIGLWRQRRVELWLEKLGAKEPFSGNWATKWSNIKEEEAITMYIQITRNELSFPTFQVYRDDWIAASPDGLVERIVDGVPSRGVLEIKCPCFQDMKSAEPWTRVPLYYVPQAQGLMEIADAEWMDFYVWTPRGSNLFRISRDVEYWKLLKSALDDFWFEHVLPAKELCVKYEFTDPFMELPLLRPGPRHERCEDIIRESRRIADASSMLLTEVNGNASVPKEHQRVHRM